MSAHWAAPLIGVPYKAGGHTPEGMDCIGLVRYYFRARHGVELPDYHLHAAPGDLHAFVRATGWHPCSLPYRDEDILTMENHLGKHVGVVIETCEGTGLLHASGTDDYGSVIWQPLSTLFGYRNYKGWRKTCAA